MLSGTWLMMWFPFHVHTGYSYILDINTRLMSSDAYVGSYYFLWTNLTYLPLFFFTLLALTLLPLPSIGNNQIYLILAILFTFYAVETVDYLVSNSTLSSNSYGLRDTNNLLTNMLNRYHPFIFYSSLAIAFSCFFLSISAVLNNAPLFIRSPLISFVEPISWISCIINFTSLWMGSWWALQEGTWGGWWNWDSSETFGLLIAVVTISLLHTKLTQHSILTVTNKLKFLWLLILISYFFIQLNFELVSHNFGSKFFFFFNNNLFHLESVLIIAIATIAILINLISNNYRSRILRTVIVPFMVTEVPLVRIVPTIVVVTWILISYCPLINYFFWNFLSIQVMNSEPSIQPVNFVAAIALLSLTINSSTVTTFMIVVCLYYLTNWLWIVPILTVTGSIYSSLHSVILLISILNLTLHDLTPLSSVFSCLLALESSVTCSLDSTTFEILRKDTTPEGSNASDWGLYADSNSGVINYTSFNTRQNSFKAVYDLGSLYLTTCFEITLPLVGSLNSAFVACLFLLKVLTFRFSHNVLF